MVVGPSGAVGTLGERVAVVTQVRDDGTLER